MKINLETQYPLYSDLVNNKQLFDDHFDESELYNFNYEDNTDYSDFPHIDEFLQRDFNDYELNRSHVVQVPINYIWSSEKTKGGFDRAKWATQNKVQNISNLNTPNGGGNPKGYNEADAGILSGILRPRPNTDGSCDWQLVKYIGNNRIVKKLIANNGEITNVLMCIRFHKQGLKQSDYIQIEAERHTTDAGDRSGQNESQKFTSSYRSGRKHAVECFNFLKSQKLNYDGIMQIENVEGAEDFLNITSLSGLKEGIGNGFFKKFGESNVIAAIKTVREVAKITGETHIGMSPIECLSLMFQSFTEHGKTQTSVKMMFTKEELQKFFVAYYTKMNDSDDMFSGNGNKSRFLLKHLNANGFIKCMVYIAANSFWPALPNYWQNIRNTDTSFSQDCWAVKQFISKSKDSMLKRDITAKVT
tara:strand:- start:195 stop:1445 length:1251 start_codon:yes stop_codon:yes gene_type:complete